MPALKAQLTPALNRAFSASLTVRSDFLGRCPRLWMNAAPLARLYRLSISFRRSSLVLPSFCSRRPSSSSSFPSANARSSSVNCAYFCFSLPLTSFQLPLNPSFVIAINISPAERRLVASHVEKKCKRAPISQCEFLLKTHLFFRLHYPRPRAGTFSSAAPD